MCSSLFICSNGRLAGSSGLRTTSLTRPPLSVPTLFQHFHYPHLSAGLPAVEGYQHGPHQQFLPLPLRSVELSLHQTKLTLRFRQTLLMLELCCFVLAGGGAQTRLDLQPVHLCLVYTQNVLLQG